jgi:multisubunit Na+/H+ antiporter MnhB subunit
MEILIIALLIFMIIAALNALETKDLLSSVVSLGAVGFGLSVAFLAMGAPDIAIVQIVVEVLSLIILIRATIRSDLTTVTKSTEFFGLFVGLVLLFVVFLFGLEAVKVLPPFGTPVMDVISSAPSRHYLEHGLSETGSANIVTSIILGYRGYDTLGEVTVLFASVLGALAILRNKPLKKKKKTDDE